MKSFKNFFIKKYLNPIDNTIEYNPEQLAKGIEVEMEHTPYKAVAEVIAKQQLAEDPYYYIKPEKTVDL